MIHKMYLYQITCDAKGTDRFVRIFEFYDEPSEHDQLKCMFWLRDRGYRVIEGTLEDIWVW